MKYSLAPGFIVVRYTTNGHPHRMNLPVAPAALYSPGDTPSFQPNSGAPIDLSTFAADFGTAFRPFFANTGTYDSVEYWQQPDHTDDPLFINSDISAAGVGTNVTACVAWSEGVMTFRTDAGGIFKMYVMEGSLAVNDHKLPPLYGGFAACQGMAAYLLGTSGIVRGRDNGKILMGLNLYTKTSDALRRKYTF